MINVDKRTHRLLTYLLYVVFCTGYIVIFSNNIGYPVLTLIIYTLMLALTITNHIKYYRYEAVNPKGKIILIINMVLAFGIIHHDYSNFEQLFLLVIIADCILAFSIKFSLSFIFVTYLIYYPFIYLLYNTRPGWEFRDEFLSDIVISTFCIIILLFVKLQININVKYNDLLIKSEISYKQLKTNSNKIEELAVVEERNRIALVLHNSLGHSLTSIMLSLQAEKMELISDGQLDKEAFQTVEKLIQDAMKLLRSTIENADDFMKDIPFDDLMDIFIREASNNSKVKISYEANNTHQIVGEQKSIIFNIILESITNAMKHSNCRQIKINISGFDTQVIVTICDDGCGFDSIQYGFGISKMKEQVERINGTYEILSKEGCQVKVTLPFKEVTKNV